MCGWYGLVMRYEVGCMMDGEGGDGDGRVGEGGRRKEEGGRRKEEGGEKVYK